MSKLKNLNCLNILNFFLLIILIIFIETERGNKHQIYYQIESSEAQFQTNLSVTMPGSTGQPPPGGGPVQGQPTSPKSSTTPEKLGGATNDTPCRMRSFEEILAEEKKNRNIHRRRRLIYCLRTTGR